MASVKPNYYRFEGLNYSHSFEPEKVKSAINYKAKKDEVYLITYPRCGTTWTQVIVYLIYNDGKPPMGFEGRGRCMPFLEKTGAEGAETMDKPGLISLHQPFHRTPYHSEAKYIHITRNPFDACVSYFHHHKGFPSYNFQNGLFDTFFEMFLSGECEFGDYFENLLSWWQHKDDPNVLFLVYEQMRASPRDHVLRIAKFLGDNYYQKLIGNEELLEKILAESHIDAMRPKFNIVYEPGQLSATGGEGKEIEFIRQGAVKGWSDFINQDQEKRLRDKFIEKVRNTGIEILWADLF